MIDNLEPGLETWPPPFYFYFNDLQLPPWTAQWSVCRLDEIAGCDAVDSDGFHDHEKAAQRAERWRIECIIDHVGMIESEDPLVFKIGAMDVLFDLLANRAADVGSSSACGSLAMLASFKNKSGAGSRNFPSSTLGDRRE